MSCFNSDITIAMLGLDNAGKTSVVLNLAKGKSDDISSNCSCYIITL